jgi:uncharacterized membrane protein YvbJ
MTFKKCPKCGESIKDDARNCPNCGEFITRKQIVDGVYENSSEYKRNNSIKSLLYFITFIMPYLGIIIGGAYTASDNPKKQEFGKQLMIFGLIMLFVLVIIWVTILKNLF